MIIWIDAQLSPSLAPWITDHFKGVEATAVRDLGLQNARDKEIFEKALAQGAIVMTKDDDFLQLGLDKDLPPASSGSLVEILPTRK